MIGSGQATRIGTRKRILHRRSMRRMSGESAVRGLVKSIFLLVNSASGTGSSDLVVGGLTRGLEGSDVEKTSVQVVSDHVGARTAAARFLAAAREPCAIIVGGGGGTLRAVVEAVCSARESDPRPEVDPVRIGVLRMGSGNLLARRLGMPPAAEAGLSGILENLQRERTVPVSVMRCETHAPDGSQLVLFGLAMAGFGQFGCAPADLARWHRRLGRLRRSIALPVGLERLNQWEYVLALVLRTLGCAWQPKRAERVEVVACGQERRLRLLAGAFFNLPFEELPFDAGVRLEERALSVSLIPCRGRLATLRCLLSPAFLVRCGWHFKLTGTDRCEIRLLDRESVEFFLDEDPVLGFQSIALTIGTTLAFVPGPGYAWPPEGPER